jgi:hypothetical protein
MIVQQIQILISIQTPFCSHSNMWHYQFPQKRNQNEHFNFRISKILFYRYASIGQKKFIQKNVRQFIIMPVFYAFQLWCKNLIRLFILRLLYTTLSCKHCIIILVRYSNLMFYNICNIRLCFNLMQVTWYT